ncbi:MAG: ABC transporter substrate-binding protein [Clostridia bacterium]|nr:ABC transporter substrate-binding protein [Clostridia bacterium]
MKRFLVLTLALLMLTGCSPAAQTPTGQKDSVVVVLSTEAEPEAGFDPAYGWGAGEHVHEPLIQSTLTVTNADLTVGYDLATDMSVSDDGLTWTVKLRDGVVFSDGKALTAKDVAFTYNTVKETTSIGDFTMLSSAEASDDSTVLFHMAHPYSIWPYTMAIVGIVPEHAYDAATYGRNPIGSGRYIMKQWDKGQQVILEANPSYYGEAPKMKKVTILFMGEDAAYLAVKAGQADVAYTAASYAADAPKDYGLLSVGTVDNRGINLPGFDLNVRKAINAGIDRASLVKNVLDGYGTPAYTVCDGMPWCPPDAAIGYDPDTASALLDADGWTQGADGVRVKDGQELKINLLYPSGDSVRQALAAELSNQLARLGFRSSYEAVGWDTAYDRAETEPLVWGWGSHTPMEVYNIYGDASPEVAQLLTEAMESTGLEASYPLWQKAQEADQSTWAWLVNVNHLFWVRDGLTVAEQKLHPHGHGWSIVNNVDQWSWAA